MEYRQCPGTHHHPFGGQPGCQAKVTNLSYTVVGQPDIPWFQVSVDDTSGVGKLQTPASFLGDIYGLFEGQMVVCGVFDVSAPTLTSSPCSTWETTKASRTWLRA